ncbi:hypothetical protein FHT92_001824 [Rhizobium sp. BK377]|nr:hypothetical protein [Rhizobium sp. BK377]
MIAGGTALLPCLIPVLVTGIQPACVRKPKRLLKNNACLRHSSIMKGYVYILASQRNGTLYTGVTRDIAGRLFEHQNELQVRTV